MNEITNIMPAGPATMSSREIAELCDKRHDHVMRDIKTMLDALNMSAPSFGGSYTGENGKVLPCYNLPRDLTMTLVTGYSIPLRKKVIDRLDELERRGPAIALNDPSVLRQLLLDNVEKVIALESRVSELQPSHDALERISLADGSLCITEAAKALQMRPKDVFQWLRTNGWIYRRPGSGHDLGYQSKTAAGLLEHKVTTVLRADGSEKVSEQVRVTAKGLTKLAALIQPGIGRAA